MESQPLIQSELPRKVEICIKTLMFLMISLVAGIIMFMANVCVFHDLPPTALPNVLSIIIFAMLFAMTTLCFIR